MMRVDRMVRLTERTALFECVQLAACTPPSPRKFLNRATTMSRATNALNPRFALVVYLVFTAIRAHPGKVFVWKVINNALEKPAPEKEAY